MKNPYVFIIYLKTNRNHINSMRCFTKRSWCVRIRIAGARHRTQSERQSNTLWSEGLPSTHCSRRLVRSWSTTPLLLLLLHNAADASYLEESALPHSSRLQHYAVFSVVNYANKDINGLSDKHSDSLNAAKCLRTYPTLLWRLEIFQMPARFFFVVST